ncbi:MAG TPA: hypothetical protein VKX17_16240 [Planctomycetota bacterium]|nr:hypothetical protein [Planctomycetota bacterium]
MKKLTTLLVPLLLLIASHALCSGTTSPPPVITGFSSSDNPALINSTVTFSLYISSTGGQQFTSSIDFGDGTPAATFNSPAGTHSAGAVAQHTFTAYGTFNVVATVNDGINPAVTQTISQSIPMPAVLGVSNVDAGKPDLVNPINKVSMGLNASNGGVVQLDVSVASLTGDTFDPQTTFNDFGGTSATVNGPFPVHKFTHHGIFVAVTAGISRTDQHNGGIQCKMITIGANETGEQLPNARDDESGSPHGPGAPPSSAITLMNMRGRFDFTGTKNDSVVFTGNFKLPPGLDTSQPHEINVGIGNNISNTTISARGRGVTPGTPGLLKSLSVRFGVRRNAVTQGGEPATVSITFNKAGLVGTGFETEGVSKASTDTTPGGAPVARKIQIAVVLDGVPYTTLAPVNFSISGNGGFGSISGR